MSKLIDPKSIPGMIPELSLFTVPSTQVAVEKSQFVELQLKNTMNDTGPYEFEISSQPHMLDLSKTYLKFKARIVDENNQPIKRVDGQNAPLPKVAVIQAIGKTLWRQIKTLFNNVEVSDTGHLHAYRSYLETELNYSWDAKHTLLTAAGYYPDSLVDSTVNSNDSKGFAARNLLFGDGEWVELMSTLHTDICSQDKYLLNGITVRFVIYRAGLWGSGAPKQKMDGGPYLKKIFGPGLSGDQKKGHRKKNSATTWRKHFFRTPRGAPLNPWGAPPGGWGP